MESVSEHFEEWPYEGVRENLALSSIQIANFGSQAIFRVARLIEFHVQLGEFLRREGAQLLREFFDWSRCWLFADGRARFRVLLQPTNQAELILMQFLELRGRGQAFEFVLLSLDLSQCGGTRQWPSSVIRPFVESLLHHFGEF